MPVTRGVAGVLVVLAAVGMVSVSAAAPERKAPRPRIVAAVMQDADRDARADAVRLTYSARIRHAADRDGRYPFAVSGYRIRWVGAAQGRSLRLVLLEKAKPDPAARPAIRYRPTGAKPVLRLGGTQAAGQLFRKTRAHGHVAPAQSPPAQPPPTT